MELSFFLVLIELPGYNFNELLLIDRHLLLNSVLFLDRFTICSKN